MPPPRSTKGSSHSSTSASATRQDSKKARRQSDDDENEEMANAESRGSQGTEPEAPSIMSPQELIASMVEGQRKRHMGKKRNVVKAYDTTAENVHDSMDALFNEHEEKSSSAHSAQLKRLKELLNHKAKLEAQMEAKLTVLRADYDAHSRDVENVLSHKIRELK